MTGASRRRRLRFSLRTLLIAVLLLGSAVSLWLNWQPWYRVSTFFAGEPVRFAAFSEDYSRVILVCDDEVVHVMNARTGAEIEKHMLPDAQTIKLGVYAGHAICATAGQTKYPQPEEPWRIDFRARHAKPISYTFENITLDQALDILMTNGLKEKFVYNQEVIDSGRTQRNISLKVREKSALETLESILYQAELEVEIIDGAIHLVRKETYLVHHAQKKDCSVRVWELETGKQIATLSGQTENISTIAISPDGTHVLGAGNNATARVWETGGLQVAVLHSGTAIYEAGLSNNGKRAAGAMAEKIGAWNTEKDSDIFITVDLGTTSHVVVSSDGRYAAFQYQDKSVELWDLTAGTRVQSMSKQFISESNEMAPVFSLRGDRLIVVRGGESKLVLLHDDKELSLDGRIRGANFSFDNERIVATYWFGSTIIDGNSGRTLAILPQEPRRLGDIFDFSDHTPTPGASGPFGESFPVTPRFSPDRKWVIAEDAHGVVGLWAFHRPEAWWGAACVPEFWLTIVFAFAFVWSLLRDRREV